ncbi:24995_t:CDS:2, partial [Cetraspora pellucida]
TKLTKLDKKFHSANQQILLLVDGAKSHYNSNKKLSSEEESSNNKSESENKEDEELKNTKIDDSTYTVQDLEDVEKNEVDELIIDLMTNLSDPTIKCQLNEFNNMNDSQILTENLLNEKKIINIVLDEQ